MSRVRGAGSWLGARRGEDGDHGEDFPRARESGARVREETMETMFSTPVVDGPGDDGDDGDHVFRSVAIRARARACAPDSRAVGKWPPSSPWSPFQLRLSSFHPATPPCFSPSAVNATENSCPG